MKCLKITLNILLSCVLITLTLSPTLLSTSSKITIASNGKHQAREFLCLNSGQLSVNSALTTDSGSLSSFPPALSAMLHSRRIVHFPSDLSRQSTSHPTVELTSTDHRCSRGEKLEWR